jgi:hypothetical protein
MAYALRGCGIVLKSDIQKRNKAFAQFGRTPGQPVVASLFIHSVAQLAGRAVRERARGCVRMRKCCAGWCPRLTRDCGITARLLLARVAHRRRSQVI